MYCHAAERRDGCRIYRCSRYGNKPTTTSASVAHRKRWMTWWTAGMEAGVQGKVLRLRFRRGREIWQEDVLLRFTIRQSVSPLEGVER